jgi:hypothetical protein
MSSFRQHRFSQSSFTAHPAKLIPEFPVIAKDEKDLKNSFPFTR